MLTTPLLQVSHADSHQEIRELEYFLLMGIPFFLFVASSQLIYVGAILQCGMPMASTVSLLMVLSTIVVMMTLAMALAYRMKWFFIVLCLWTSLWLWWCAHLCT